MKKYMALLTSLVMSFSLASTTLVVHAEEEVVPELPVEEKTEVPEGVEAVVLLEVKDDTDQLAIEGATEEATVHSTMRASESAPAQKIVLTEEEANEIKELYKDFAILSNAINPFGDPQADLNIKLDGDLKYGKIDLSTNQMTLFDTKDQPKEIENNEEFDLAAILDVTPIKRKIINITVSFCMSHDPQELETIALTKINDEWQVITDSNGKPVPGVESTFTSDISLPAGVSLDRSGLSFLATDDLEHIKVVDNINSLFYLNQGATNSTQNGDGTTDIHAQMDLSRDSYQTFDQLFKDLTNKNSIPSAESIMNMNLDISDPNGYWDGEADRLPYAYKALLYSKLLMENQSGINPGYTPNYYVLKIPVKADLSKQKEDPMIAKGKVGGDFKSMATYSSIDGKFKFSWDGQQGHHNGLEKDCNAKTDDQIWLSLTPKKIVDITPIEPHYSTVSVDVEKFWVGTDASEQEPITVILFANGEMTDQTVVLSNENNWTATFNNLPEVDALGNPIVYTVLEAGDVNHEVVIHDDTYQVTYDKFGNYIMVTNHLVPQVIEEPAPAPVIPHTADNTDLWLWAISMISMLGVATYSAHKVKQLQQ